MILAQKGSLFRSFLPSQAVFFAHGGGYGNEEILALAKSNFNRLSNFIVWEFDVVLGGAVFVHKGHEAFVNVEEGEFVLADIGDIHVVGGWGEIFELLVGEDLQKSD